MNFLERTPVWIFKRSHRVSGKIFEGNPRIVTEKIFKVIPVDIFFLFAFLRGTSEKNPHKFLKNVWNTLVKVSKGFSGAAALGFTASRISGDEPAKMNGQNLANKANNIIK